MITPKNITKHELIGLEVEIVEATDLTLKGIKGRIIDESKQTLTIESRGKRKKIVKQICTFRFKLGETVLEVEGRAIVARPQDRIKK